MPPVIPASRAAHCLGQQSPDPRRRPPHAEASRPRALRLLADCRAGGLYLAGRQAARLLCRDQYRAFRIPRRPSGRSHNRGGPQTTRNYAWRDYGVRVGVSASSAARRASKLPATILLNSCVCEHYPDIVERIKARGDDVVGHGRTNAEELGGMWEQTRRASSPNAPRRSSSISACGRPAGWGRARAENGVTPDLLKEAGYTHNLDWPVDDQPIWMRTRPGRSFGALSDGIERHGHQRQPRPHRPRVRRHDRRSVRRDGGAVGARSRW